MNFNLFDCCLILRKEHKQDNYVNPIKWGFFQNNLFDCCLIHKGRNQ